ncbi:YveK family protein [Lachnospira multipara]|uniref:Capsular polysaccharide biosynthesis protein n=1 Tax=Lachnospira multipara TaxID=28051 RepID=A0A1H5T9A6_9FIRM|nr:Wzz/FepE/Etk N-terminal domain-containing protein [Lachnospira multipara]MBQ2472920.1 hypothetical protein [Lachnospira sp.]SEF59403.1 Capsular polysaccharide biosynthesis protein [Lachnospira multipara]
MDNNKAGEREIDLGRLFSILWDKIILIIFTGALFGAATFLASKFFITPVYNSTTQLYVLNRADDSTTTLTDLQTSTQLTKDYIILVQSRPVLEYVIEDLSLDMTTSELSDMISVTTISDSRVLQISVKNPDPYRAKEIADSIAQFSATQICEIMHIEDVEIIEEGNIATIPESTGIKRNTIIGVLLGIIFSSGVIIVKSLFDDTIKTSEDVEKYLGISTLSMIPLCKEMDDGRSKLSKKKSKKRGK